MHALNLSRHNQRPATIVKGAGATPYLIAGSSLISRPPGLGRFSCCACDHTMVDEHGRRRTIPCAKAACGPMMLNLLTKLRQFHRGRDELTMFRMFTMLSP